METKKYQEQRIQKNAQQIGDWPKKEEGMTNEGHEE